MEQYLKTLCNWNGESTKAHLNAPWHVNGHSYSTNGYCLIRVDGEYGADVSLGKYPDVEKHFDWGNIEASENGVIVPVDEIFEKQEMCTLCNGGGAVNYTRSRCDECDATGYVECKCCGHEKECDRCGGSGWNATYTHGPNECHECKGTGVSYEHESFKVNGIGFNPQLLVKLHNSLPGFKIMIDSKPCEYGVGFKFDHGDGVVMVMEERKR